MTHKIFAIFPDNYKQSMSIHPMIKPAEELEKRDVVCQEQKTFFNETIKNIQSDDIVIIWIGLRQDKDILSLSNLKCRKFLRNVDSCSSNRILFKRELELFNKIYFEAMLVTYCTDNNLKFLADRNIRSIKYPHLLDFSDRDYNNQKTFDVLISGQLSDRSYPMRTRLAKLFLSIQEKYRVGFLPHPGHKLHEVRHEFFGEKYIDLASQSKVGAVCTGDDDALVMKYLEFAKAKTLPIGDVPSNMPNDAKEQMIITHHSMLDVEILSIFENTILNIDNLSKRTLRYNQVMKENFCISNTEQILSKIRNGNYDQ